LADLIGEYFFFLGIWLIFLFEFVYGIEYIIIIVEDGIAVEIVFLNVFL